MYLHRDDIEKIADLIKKFPDCEVFEFEQDGSSGIGSVTTMSVKTTIAGTDGDFKIVISDVENW
jgi:hypothetical protein